MTKRSGNTDLLRFLSAILIVSHHIYHLGIEEYPYIKYPFFDVWIYVELFFYVSGYYTACHFDRLNETENKAKSAINYTLHKFLPILPYTFFFSLCAWITRGLTGVLFQGWTYKSFITSFLGDFAFDLIMLSDTYIHPLIGPLWFVFALFIVFPLFCLFAQMENRYLRMILCFITPLMYYGWAGVEGNQIFPHDLLRAFAGLMLGCLIYDLASALKDTISRIPKMHLTFAEIMFAAYPIVGCYLNLAKRELASTRLYLLCFFVQLLLCLPGFTYTSKIKGRFINYLGKLSLPVYVVHWFVGTLVGLLSELHFSDNSLLLFYFAGTIAVSVIAKMIYDKCNKYHQFCNAFKIELKC